MNKSVNLAKKRLQQSPPKFVSPVAESETWVTPLQKLDRHTDWVRTVAFSPDCRLLASASYDRSVRLWAAHTGKEVRVLMGHTREVTSAVFSPFGNKLLASASRDKTVRLWNADTGQELLKLEGHTESVNTVVFSPFDSDLLASASDDETIRLWNIDTRQEAQKLEGHTSDIHALAFSPSNGRLLASVSKDKTIIIWDLETGKEVWKNEGRAFNFRDSAVVFSPDGKLLASVLGERIGLWDTDTWLNIHKLDSGANEITALAFSANGKLLVSASTDQSIKLWDTSTWQRVQMFGGHALVVSTVAFSADGKLLASASLDRTIMLWGIRTTLRIQRFQDNADEIEAVGSSTNDKLLASASGDETIGLWDTNTGHEVQQFENTIAAGHRSGEFSLIRNNEWEPEIIIEAENHYEHKFYVQWKGKTYLDEQFGHQHSIESIPVLWQDRDCIVLETCAEYGCHTNPDITRLIIKLIDQLHWNPTTSTEWYEQSLGEVFWLKARGIYRPSLQTHLSSTPEMYILIETNCDLAIRQVQKILHRFALVLRPAGEMICRSKANVEVTKDITRIRLLPLQYTRLDACWLSIFTQKVIVNPHDLGHQYAISKTASRLKLSLNDLIELSGADLPVDIEGGVCLLGVYSILIPVEIITNETSKSLVWHLLSADRSERKPSKARRQLWIDLSKWFQKNKRVLIQPEHSEELRSFDCHFLGWTVSSVITLGTEDQPYKLRRTGAATQAYEEVGFTFNLGMNIGYGGSGMNASVSRTFGRTEIARDRDTDQPIKDWLAESMQEQVLLYHPDRKQAWLVPKIYVLYHLVLERIRYVTSNQELKEIVFPYLRSQSAYENANVNSDLSRLYELLASNLEHPFPHAPRQNCRLKDALHSILCALDRFERSNFTHDGQRTIRGFEAYDTIHQARFFKLRTANTSDHFLSLRALGGWVNLLDDVPIILFYKGIKDPIKPLFVEGCRECKHCRMPREKNYLAARISSLYELGKPYEERAKLADQAWWNYQDAWCRGVRKHKSIEGRLQTILTRCSPDNCPPEELLNASHNGAVIFQPGTGLTRVLKTLGKQKTPD